MIMMMMNRPLSKLNTGALRAARNAAGKNVTKNKRHKNAENNVTHANN